MKKKKEKRKESEESEKMSIIMERPFVIM